jgi:hypothetical protein
MAFLNLFVVWASVSAADQPHAIRNNSDAEARALLVVLMGQV